MGLDSEFRASATSTARREFNSDSSPMFCRVAACHFASYDPIAGSAALMEASPFMQEAAILMVPPSSPLLEAILAALLIERLLQTHAKQPLKSIPIREKAFPKASALALALFASGELVNWANAGIPTAQVVNLLANRL